MNGHDMIKAAIIKECVGQLTRITEIVARVGVKNATLKLADAMNDMVQYVTEIVADPSADQMAAEIRDGFETLKKSFET